MKWFSIYLLAFLCFVSGCNLRQQEEELKKKEAYLNEKEQMLLLKEKTLQAKEEELLLKEHKVDSVSNGDTSYRYNPAIIGIWSVKMTCVETSCPESAVGDVKTEQWNISYEANTLIAKAMVNDRLIRTYTGIPGKSSIELTEEQKAEGPSQQATKMVVRLSLLTEGTMSGQREIIRENCRVIYDLQMDKQK
jgi:hypothetical protein